MVDDAIVVIENIVRFIELGDPPLEAALKGARQIGFTVVSISLSLVAVFIPILFMGGLIGRLFHEFAVTLSVAIAVSAVVSLTLTPMLCGRFLKARNIPTVRAAVFTRRWSVCSNGWFETYEHGLKWVMRHQKITLAITVLTPFVATVLMFKVLPSGFFPQQDTGLIFGFAEGGQDISFDLMSDKFQACGPTSSTADPAVDKIGGYLGGGADNNGFMFISLKPKPERKDSADEVINRLRPKLAGIPGITLYLQAAQDLRVGGRTGRNRSISTRWNPRAWNDLRYWTPRLLDKLRTMQGFTGREHRHADERLADERRHRPRRRRAPGHPAPGRGRHALQRVRTAAGVGHLHAAKPVPASSWRPHRLFRKKPVRWTRFTSPLRPANRCRSARLPITSR